MVEAPVDRPGPDPERDLLERLAAKGPQDARYTLQGEVARGGMGAIVRIWDNEVRRALAMKVILGHSGSEECTPADPVHSQKLDRFLEEAQVTGQLDHPGVVPVHEIGIDSKGTAYFTMKLVNGEDLTRVFAHVHAGQDGWNMTRAVGVFLKVCEAMSYAHSKGVVHRDLKPSNVMVGGYGEVYVMDWGLARVVGHADRKDIRIRPALPASALESVRTERREKRDATPDSPFVTMDGDVVGTPAYMPPEQARGDVNEVGPHSDVYAVGAMLYHLLSNAVPHVPAGTEIGPFTVLRAVLDGSPVPIRQLAPDAPSELVSICEKAMAREIAARYPNMQALADDLRAFLEGRVVGAYETGAVAEFKKWVQRNRALAVSSAAAVVAALAGLGGIVAVQASANTKLTEVNSDLEAAKNIARSSEVGAKMALADVLRLADVKRLEDYKAEAEELWPALPETVGAMEAWLRKARELAGRSPIHKATLEALRARALPYSEADRARDTETHPLKAELASIVRARTARAAQSGSTPPGQPADEADDKLGELDAKIADVEQRMSERRTWTFVDTEAQWQHDTLASLVAGVEVLADTDPAIGTIADVEARLEFARHIAERSIDNHAVAWSAAVASIANTTQCPQYGGVAVKPQVGLIPIGMDPQSGLWEFSHVATGDAPVRGADGKLQLTGSMGLVLVLLPGGAFDMGATKPTEQKPLGSPNVDPQANPDESPVNTVTLAPFFLSKYEMTQGQWMRATRRNPSLYKAGGRIAGRTVTLLEPVEQIDAAECEGVMRMLGLALPTEAQWEYGNRAGTTTIWWTGNIVESLQDAANVADSYAKKYGGPPNWTYEDALNDWYIVRAPIGGYRANNFGLHDTVGNVWEWCRDWYADDYGRPAHPGDGLRADSGITFRIGRGGSFASNAAEGRSSYRYVTTHDRRHYDHGVRPARSITE